MTVNISGFGLQVQIVASQTFPQGVTITQFADDADPFDIPSIQQADKAMGLNGDLIIFSKANPALVTISVIPSSDDDKNMQVLSEANRVGRGKRGANDTIQMVAVYPDGSTIVLGNGALTDAMPGNSIASAGRQKSKAYVFAFENVAFTYND